MSEQQKNAVVKTTHLHAYPGWVVREYRHGQFDACHTSAPAISPGCKTFAEALDYARRNSCGRLGQ